MLCRALLCCLCLLMACTPPAVAQQTFTREQVQAAADTVKADPLLSGTKQEKFLRWKKQEQDKKAPTKTTSWWRWLYEQGQRLAQGVRLLMWLALAGLAAFVLVRLPAWLRLRGDRLSAKNTAAPPAHVNTLDIRPDSLPADIGGAAAALWQRGEARAALSLLYRGALSRLVHVHGVPIRAACTENQCLHLAALHLPPAGLQFFTAVVQAWQGLAWGHQQPADAEVLALCNRFEQRLSPATRGRPTT